MSENEYIRILATVEAGRRFTIDDIEPELDAAQVTASEKGAALRKACNDGYLTSLVETATGEWVHASRKSTRPSRDGGMVTVYTRTAKPVPAHVCQEVA